MVIGLAYKNNIIYLQKESVIKREDSFSEIISQGEEYGEI